MSMKKPSNKVETEEKNRLFQIDKKHKNSGQQKKERMRKKPIVDSMAD